MGRKRKYEFQPLAKKGFVRIDKGDSWEDISVNTTDLSSGKYSITGITGNISISLDANAQIGDEWEFSNSDYSIVKGSAEVTIGDATSQFTDETGAYVVGELILDASNIHLKLVKKGVNTYHVVIDGAVQLIPTNNVEIAGTWDASTNTPDLDLAESRINIEGDYLRYLVSVSGSYDLGAGLEEFEAGDVVQWWSPTAYRIDRNSDNALVLREDFDGFTLGQTVLTVVEPIPSNASVQVIRNGRLLREGIANDYTLTGQTVTFTSGLNPIESAVVLWVLNTGKEFVEAIDSPVLGSTTITPTINAGNLPATANNLRVYRQGRLLRSGLTNDYTVAGNIITLSDPVIFGDSFVIIINE